MQNSGGWGVAKMLFGAAAAAVLWATLLNGSSMQAQQTGSVNAAELGLMPLPSHFEARHRQLLATARHARGVRPLPQCTPRSRHSAHDDAAAV